MTKFASAWVDAWNRRDLDAILDKFEDDAIFISPLAESITGSAIVTGKASLRQYWEKALAQHTELSFTLDHAIWDPKSSQLAVIYIAALNGVRRRACELLTFNARGRQVRGEAFRGAVVT